MAVLLRSVKANAEPITDGFKAAGIPYVVVGMTNLFGTAEAEACRQLFYFMASRADVDAGVIARRTVKLRRYSGDWVLASCRGGRGAPLRCRFCSEHAKRRPREEMALEVEGIVDGSVHAEERLCRCR
jgi:hypothetical protein